MFDSCRGSRVSLARKYENVYIDTSAYTPERYPETLVQFMKGPGRRKVTFGSNFPMIQQGKRVAQLGSRCCLHPQRNAAETSSSSVIAEAAGSG